MAPHFSEHIRTFPVSPISKLAPYSALILSIVLIVLFLIRFYLLQLFLLQKFHGSKYTLLNDVNRRNFTNHYIACATRLTIFIIGVYPFGSVVFGGSNFHTPYAHGSRATMGDILLISTQMLSGMLIFDLLYRVHIPLVSVAHHIASIAVAQIMVTISVKGLRESSVGFIICSVWGAFYIVVEFFPHLAMILYRIYPTSHYFLANVFKLVCIITFVGTIFQTFLIIYMFRALWNRWHVSFKIIMPLLHISFLASQLQGTRSFYIMWRKQEYVEKDSENRQ